MTSFISWVAAKSVHNSSKLGAKSVVGGLAYGARFVGVFTSGLIIITYAVKDTIRFQTSYITDMGRWHA